MPTALLRNTIRPWLSYRHLTMTAAVLLVAVPAVVLFPGVDYLADGLRDDASPLEPAAFAAVAVVGAALKGEHQSAPRCRRDARSREPGGRPASSMVGEDRPADSDREDIEMQTKMSNIAVAMFTVADQDAARAFYTEKLGFEVRSDSRFGEHDEMRWLEVAPPGSSARLALNPPMGAQPGGGMIGVETADVAGEHARLTVVGGIDLDPEPMRTPGAPLMFMLRDPDGNNVVVVEAPSG